MPEQAVRLIHPTQISFLAHPSYSEANEGAIPEGDNQGWRPEDLEHIFS
jgi:hypothetical protein